MTIEDLRARGLILLECVSGSRAYGLATPASDTDIRGVYLLPQADIYGLRYVPQVANASNDVVYYELGRFMDLLAKNNPNILELLAAPPDTVLYRHPAMDLIRPELFLSRKCRHTFAGYALSQIKKARGLNKKIVNPVDRERKDLLSFCYLLKDQGAEPLHHWLQRHQRVQERCGLVSIPHFPNVYAVFYDEDGRHGYRGIQQKETATTVLLSSVPKEAQPVGYLHFNQDGYMTYCREYREYWDWVKNRNQARYQTNLAHGHDYDSKNMMHTFRLLDMAEEILSRGEVVVRRPNREELLTIRSGAWGYDELMEKADQKMQAVDAAWQNSPLPDEPDMDQINALLVELRRRLYEERDSTGQSH